MTAIGEKHGILWNTLSLSKVNKEDIYQTPIESVTMILPHIAKYRRVWEISCGRGNIVQACREAGHEVIGTDILQDPKEDFLVYVPDFEWDVILTNPPFSLKYEFLLRCYQHGKPFILLLPLDCLGYVSIAKLIGEKGSMTIFVPPRKIKYIDKAGRQNCPHFSSAFFGWKVTDATENKVVFV